MRIALPSSTFLMMSSGSSAYWIAWRTRLSAVGPLYGPVPIGCREISAGSLPAYAFGGYIDACANVMMVRNVGHGLLVWTRIVYGSTISTRSIGRKLELARIFGSFTRSMLNFADSA